MPMRYVVSLLFFIVFSLLFVFLVGCPWGGDDDTSTTQTDNSQTDKSLTEQTRQNQPVPPSVSPPLATTFESKLEPAIIETVNRLSDNSAEGLVETESSTGFTVHLERRFQTVPVAVIDESGEVIIQDFTGPIR